MRSQWGFMELDMCFKVSGGFPGTFCEGFRLFHDCFRGSLGHSRNFQKVLEETIHTICSDLYVIYGVLSIRSTGVLNNTQICVL